VVFECHMGHDSDSFRPRRFVFDSFQIDQQSGEVLKNGHRVRLQAQPFQLLLLLLERPGEVVTREEIRHQLWSGDTFVDFNHGLGTAVSKVREALGDSAENPRFIETLPKRGFRFIGELKQDTPTSPVSVPPRKLEVQPRGRSWALLISSAGLVALLLFTGWLVFRPHHHAENLVAVPFSTLPGVETAPAISPDGTRIAFAWNGGLPSAGKGFDLYVKAVGSETVLPLTKHPSEWLSPVWSPDGTEIAFHRMDGDNTGIYVVSALGGEERKLKSTRIGYSVAAPISWAPDGQWIAFTDSAPGKPDGSFLISLKTLEVQPIAFNSRCTLGEATPTFSHSGTQLVYVCVISETEIELYTASPTGDSPRHFATFHNYPAGYVWTADDRKLLLCQATNDGPVLDEINISDGSFERLHFADGGLWPSVSAQARKLAYSIEYGSSAIWRRDLIHADAPMNQLMSSTREQHYAEYSPDGRRIAFISYRSGALTLWMGDADGNNLVQLSNLDSGYGAPRWSPDGRRIAFDAHHGDRFEIYVVDIAERIPRKLTTNVPTIERPYWSRDGAWIYFTSSKNGGRRIYRCPASGGDATPISPQSAIDATNPEESFGNTLYFASRTVNTPILQMSLDRSPDQATTAYPVEGMPPVAYSGTWAVARNGIYFVPASSGNDLQFYDFATKRTKTLFSIQDHFSSGLSLSPDGRYLLFSKTEQENAEIVVVNGFK
jgi:Tol biopolymer transport system component/DNA-binding winged helix-turn-helix (wHTH) protein